MAKARGQGRVYRPSYTDKGKKKKVDVWWIDYYLNGKRVRESSGSTVQRDATDLLHKRLADRGQSITRRDLERVTFGQLEALIVTDYEKNGMRSLYRLKRSLKHLRTAFSGWRVVDISEAAIDRYAVDRLAEGAANATVNRELAALKRMFRLGHRTRLVGRVPAIVMLRENNVRKDFVEEAQFQAIKAELPDRLKPLAEVYYITGARSSELLSRRWRHVDLKAGWLRMEPGETKNDDGRMWPLIPRLRDALEEQYEQKQETERRTGRIVDALFFYPEDGRPIKCWRGGVAAGACIRAGYWKIKEDRDGNVVLDRNGVPKKTHAFVRHDFRRGATRNLERAGVPRSVAMKLTGHKTESVYRRYAIVDEGMVEEQTAKLTALFDRSEAAPERKILDLTGKEQAKKRTGTA